MLTLEGLYPEMASAIEEELEDLPAVPPENLGPVCDQLGKFYRTAAIGALLFEMDTDGFYHMLMRSGLTRVYLLQRMQPEEREDSRYGKLTRANGFFDAVAAARFDIAVRINDLSPTAWSPTYEYEDDYCYIKFLHETVRAVTQDARVDREGLLRRMLEVLDGTPWVRYNVCLALLQQDTEAFDDAFLRLLDEREAEVETDRKATGRDDLEFLAGQYVFVEGLALLRLAEKVGIATREEYLFCPVEARWPMRASFSNTGYPQ